MNYLPPRKIKAKPIPKVRTRPRRTSAIKCRAHLRWVTSTFDCLIKFREGHTCAGPIDPHHVVSRGAGGGDEQVAPLCRNAHTHVHSMGVDSFNEFFRVDLASTAAILWEQSPHGKLYRREATATLQVGTPDSATTTAEVQEKDSP